MKDDEMVAHYAGADGGSAGVTGSGQLAERVVVGLPRLCILRTARPERFELPTFGSLFRHVQALVRT
jgi:hypothetical protein